MLVLRRPPFVKLTCLCLELGDLATCRRPPRVTVRPARPPPSYAAAPRVSAGTTSVRGERARHQNTRAAPVAHRGPPRGSGGLPGRGGRPGRRTSSRRRPPVAEVRGPKLRRRAAHGAEASAVRCDSWSRGGRPGEGRRQRPDPASSRAGEDVDLPALVGVTTMPSRVGEDEELPPALMSADAMTPRARGRRRRQPGGRDVRGHLNSNHPFTAQVVPTAAQGVRCAAPAARRG